MKTAGKMLVAAMLLAMGPALMAQTNIVGKDAPAFDAAECINTPEATSMEQCKGEVVLIKYWGTK
jgi:hypothetical protein